jgi:hypothetical protein
MIRRGNILKKAIALVLIILNMSMSMLSCSDSRLGEMSDFVYRPDTYPNSIWISDCPDIWFQVESDDNGNTSCEGTLITGTRAIRFGISFYKNNTKVLFDCYGEEQTVEHISDNHVLAIGNCVYDDETFTVEIKENNIFDPSVDRIVFTRKESRDYDLKIAEKIIYGNALWHMYHDIDRACDRVRIEIQKKVDYDAAQYSNTSKNIVFIMENYAELEKVISLDYLQTYLYYRGIDEADTYKISDKIAEQTKDFLNETDGVKISELYETNRDEWVAKELSDFIIRSELNSGK